MKIVTKSNSLIQMESINHPGYVSYQTYASKAEKAVLEA